LARQVAILGFRLTDPTEQGVAPRDEQREGHGMKRQIRALVVVGGLLTTMVAAAQTFAQKPGGTLKLSHFDSPASMSILEESTRAPLGIFNNLVMYTDPQHGRTLFDHLYTSVLFYHPLVLFYRPTAAL
jgi:hypothetical protein